MTKNLGIKIKLLEKLEFGYKSIKDFYENKESILVKIGEIVSDEHFKKDIIIPIRHREEILIERELAIMLIKLCIPSEIRDNLLMELKLDKNYNNIIESVEKLSISDISLYFPSAINIALEKLRIKIDKPVEIYYEKSTINIRSHYHTYSYTFPTSDLDKIDNRDNTVEITVCDQLFYLKEVFDGDIFENEFSEIFESRYSYGSIREEEDQLYVFKLSKDKVINAIKSIKYSRKNLITPFIIKDDYVLYRNQYKVPLQIFMEKSNKLNKVSRDEIFGKYKIFDVDYPFEMEDLSIPKYIEFLISTLAHHFKSIMTDKDLDIYSLTFDISNNTDTPELILHFNCFSNKYLASSPKRISVIIRDYIKNGKVSYVTYNDTFYHIGNKNELRYTLDKLLFNLFDIEVGGYKIRDILLEEEINYVKI